LEFSLRAYFAFFRGFARMLLLLACARIRKNPRPPAPKVRSIDNTVQERTMKSNTDTGWRRWTLGLVLALTVNLALWSLAGIAFSAEALGQSGGAGAEGFGLLQWKVS